MGEKKQNKSSRFHHLKDKEILTYDDIEDLVEYIVKTNAYKFTFDNYTVEDISQEIRIKCFLLLDKWKKDRPKGNPIWFFAFSTQNYLKNLRRNKNTKIPTYDSKSKRINKTMFSIDNKDFHLEGIYDSQDFNIMNQEVRVRLTPKQLAYYDEMMSSYSLRGVPSNIKKQIFKVMYNVMGYEGPDNKLKFLTKASHLDNILQPSGTQGSTIA